MDLDKLPCRACGDTMVPTEICRFGPVVRALWTIGTTLVAAGLFVLWFTNTDRGTSYYSDPEPARAMVQTALAGALVVSVAILTFVQSQSMAWACQKCGHWIARTTPPTQAKGWQ